MRWNYRTKKMLIVIISLLFIFQVTSVVALGQVDKDKGTVPSTSATDDSSPDTEDTPIFDPFSVLPVISPDSAIKNPPVSSTDACDVDSIGDTKAEVYASVVPTAASVVASQPKLTLVCPSEVSSGSYFKVKVTSEDDIPVPDVSVFFLDTFVTNEQGIVSLKAPQVKEYTKLPITAKKTGYMSATAYIPVTADMTDAPDAELSGPKPVSPSAEIHNAQYVFEILNAMIKAAHL